MKEIYNALKESYQEDPKDFIEGVVGATLIFLFIWFLFWFMGTFMYDMV
jgi:hypothetical protein